MQRNTSKSECQSEHDDDNNGDYDDGDEDLRQGALRGIGAVELLLARLHGLAPLGHEPDRHPQRESP